MSFRLVPKSVTLNDLEPRNGPYFAFFTELGSFHAHIALKWLKKNVNILRQKCSPKASSF